MADFMLHRCGRDVPKLNGEYAICNPDDDNAHCCSNGGYCGNSPAHCSCDGCVDFRKKPKYRYPEKRWWTWADGADKAGQCGPSAPKVKGQTAICDFESSGSYCCSSGGFCGGTAEHCDCEGCVNFKTNPKYQYPEKQWWTWADGPDKSGRCGPTAPQINGKMAICDPSSSTAYCCAASGYCGSTSTHCNCNGCVNYKTQMETIGKNIVKAAKDVMKAALRISDRQRRSAIKSIKQQAKTDGPLW